MTENNQKCSDTVARVVAKALGSRNTASLLEYILSLAAAYKPEATRRWKAVGPGNTVSHKAAKTAEWIRYGVCTLVNVTDGREYPFRMSDVYRGLERFALADDLEPNNIRAAVTSGMNCREAYVAMQYMVFGQVEVPVPATERTEEEPAED